MKHRDDFHDAARRRLKDRRDRLCDAAHTLYADEVHSKYLQWLYTAGRLPHHDIKGGTEAL